VEDRFMPPKKMLKEGISIGIKDVKYLLEKVKLLNDKHQYIAKITGENFNLFSLLNVEYDEVRTHSAFIAELINPCGSHNQGGKFFGLFREVVGLKNDYDTEKLRVIKEKYSPDNGRIDIWISDSKNVLIIENKLHAEDQNDQIERYFKEAKKWAGPQNIEMLYLTLDGSEPSENSLNNDETKEYVKCISYREHIMSWLEKCIKEVATITISREAIHQYLILIRKITRQELHEGIKMDLINILQEGDNFKLAVIIYDQIENVRRAIENKFWCHFRDEMDSAIEKENMKLTYNDKLAYVFSAKDIVLKSKLNSINHGCYGVYYVVKENFIDEYDLIFCVEVDSNLYMGFSLIDKHGKSLDINELENTDKITSFSEELRNRKFKVNYKDTKNFREKELIGWTYLNDTEEPMCLSNIQQIKDKGIFNDESIKSYAIKLENKVFETIQGISVLKLSNRATVVETSHSERISEASNRSGTA